MSQFDELKEEAFAANQMLPALNLVQFTFGNVSAADRQNGVFAIKPSGVAYDKLTPKKMVIVDFDGKIVDGKLRPSSDTNTHAVLYSQWPEINGICHTHSLYATAWAQSGRDIPIFGTTHADYLTVDVPCAVPLGEMDIRSDYEKATGFQIVGCFEQRKLKYQEIEMILLGHHAPFTWGNTASKAVYNSAVLENIAHMALVTIQINPEAPRLPEALINKHFERKHGPGRYYGQ